jgi:two-component system cell cycle sensor histidine kinase/response regulator CckA
MAKTKVLVVEDNPEIEALVVEHLRLGDFDVSEAFTSDEALSHLDGPVTFDVLFIDVRIPGSSDGIEVAHRFRAGNPNIPILISSGYGAQMGGLIAELGPPSSFIPKPYSLVEMSEILTRMVGRPA